tara:strand:+ start:34 stop:240 length:207 start_codon:yes stop_codon:yes gene_type:complete
MVAPCIPCMVAASTFFSLVGAIGLGIISVLVYFRTKVYKIIGVDEISLIKFINLLFIFVYYYFLTIFR